jgi:nucleoid DNA-binding protein
MIKDDIVKRVSDALGKKTKDTLPIVDEVFECMKDIIIEEGRLEIRDFGVFQIKRRKSRVGRNPRNKVEYPIPERRVVTFKAGKIIKSRAERIAERSDSVGPALDGARHPLAEAIEIAHKPSSDGARKPSPDGARHPADASKKKPAGAASNL